jgi:hypothetical protein
MQRVFYFLLPALLTSLSLVAQSPDIVVLPDSVFVQGDPSDAQIDLPSHIYNNTANPVTIRWTRVVEQAPPAWDYAFCDLNLCYIGIVESEVFELMPGDSGLLKPIFYLNHSGGLGVMRIYLQSETPGVVWADTAVYVAAAGVDVGIDEAELVRDLALFPNPAQHTLQVTLAREIGPSQWYVTDAAGRTAMPRQPATGAFSSQLDISILPVGSYYFHIVSADNRVLASKPFVIQR